MRPDAQFVSTGQLPAADAVQSALGDAHARFVANRDGRNSTVYPALATADPSRFGLCLVEVSGRTHAIGDVDVSFTIMSVAKPFVFALVCQHVGPERAGELIGVGATGRPFDSLAAVELSNDGRTNPMVNAGALATTSLIPGATHAEKWEVIVDGLSAFAGRPLTLDQLTYESASQTNFRNRALAWTLRGRDRLYGEPDEVLDLYTRQSSLAVTARDLATMGATLADGGVNPITGQRVLDQAMCHHVLAVMITAGLYESSGDWFYQVGLPGKSGIGGGIVTVSPGKAGLGSYSPPLDSAGNSVRGVLSARYLSQRLGLDLLTSMPAR